MVLYYIVLQGSLLLFGWLRSQLFNSRPIISALIAPDSLIYTYYNRSLFLLTLLYPFSYTLYTVTPFWENNHRYTYELKHSLCYANYSYRTDKPRDNKVPMVMTTFFQCYEIALHIGVIMLVLYPFSLYLKEMKADKLSEFETRW